MLAAVAISLVACASFKDTAGRSLASVAITADSAMKGWAQWVALGKATDGQQATVKDAYGKYQASMAIATNAYMAGVITGDTIGWERAASVLEANQVGLISLITTFQTQTKIQP